MRQYEIWWAQLELPAGRRPVLILSRDDAHRYLGSIIVAEITSTIRGIDQEVLLGAAEGLSRRCVASLDNVRTVAVRKLVERIGSLHLRRERELKRALGHALMWRELSSISLDRHS